MPALTAGKEKPKRAEGAGAVKLPSGFNIEQGIVFKTVGEKKLDLMLVHPSEKKFEKAPLVVYIHGGGWAGGDKYRVLKDDMWGVVTNLTQRGYAFVSLEYRLVDGQPTTAMDAVADCKDALRFLVAHAEQYGIDPTRIGTFGSSAGGHLTLVTALGDEANYPCDKTIGGGPVPVRCVAAFYPLVSLRMPELFERNAAKIATLLGGSLEAKMDEAKKLSPLDLVHPGSPAILVAHGDHDETLPFQNSIAMQKAALEKGVPVECIISKGAGHGFRGEGIDPSVTEISKQTADFFYHYLAPQ